MFLVGVVRSGRVASVKKSVYGKIDEQLSVILDVVQDHSQHRITTPLESPRCAARWFAGADAIGDPQAQGDQISLQAFARVT